MFVEPSCLTARLLTGNPIDLCTLQDYDYRVISTGLYPAYSCHVVPSKQLYSLLWWLCMSLLSWLLQPFSTILYRCWPASYMAMFYTISTYSEIQLPTAVKASRIIVVKFLLTKFKIEDMKVYFDHNVKCSSALAILMLATLATYS